MWKSERHGNGTRSSYPYLHLTKTDMEQILTAKWRKLDGTRIDIPIQSALEKSLIHERELGNQIKVCIGTDSQVRGIETEFATVIVLLRKGRGGFMFINNEKTTQRMRLKERLLTEVSRS